MKRSEIIFLYDIKDNNPNGDPLDMNKPRIDEETGINIVTEVRLKRTVRDYLNEYEGKEIFVIEKRDDEDNVQDAKGRARDFTRNKNEKLKDMKEFQNIKNEISNNIISNCIDARLFGVTIPLEFKVDKKNKPVKSSITFTGPVQFNMGRSLHKVSLKRIKGTGAFASGEGKDNKTFREEYILPYSLVGFYGIVNEHAAEETKLKEEDVELLQKAIWNGTKNLISRSKVGQMPRLLVKVNYKENNFHIGDLLSKIKLQTKLNEEEEIRSMNDYVLSLDNLVNILDKNTDKIESIGYLVDDELKFVLENKNVNFKDAISKHNPIEIKIEG
ncbi:type I-B CRISPR-associated protein Cas7/Csh2 [Haloimpatiens lingqiaonensis]|uniref:type I-B CRISPR-associated protein Cas7/Csh2 n=1 Tax=Haloimpatiens lingqiaonensis TaxID=1380675 RepID=UPI0010FD49A3|nr:type I-B CRISPR-associated protein Cas7/Csh2 [Haloimpatiens lingqiaonensis]